MRRRRSGGSCGVGSSLRWLVARPSSGRSPPLHKRSRKSRGLVSFGAALPRPAITTSRCFGKGSESWATSKGRLLELRWAEGRVERMPELVAELVGLKVDVLVVVSTPAALAAKNATQTIPIVMLAPDPVGLGLVGSQSRPGGNVTGLSLYYEAIAAKRL